MHTLLAPCGQVLRKICLFKPLQSREPLPDHCCFMALSHDSAPLKVSYLLAQTSVEVFLSILEFARHEQRIAHGPLMTPSLRGWEVFPTHGALAHTRITWALPPPAPQVSGVIPGSPLCPWCFGHPFGEVHNYVLHLMLFLYCPIRF